MGTLPSFPELLEAARGLHALTRGFGWSERRAAVVAWAERWQRPEEHFPDHLDTLARASGLSRPMVVWAARTTCATLTPEAIDAWVATAVEGPPSRLDGGTVRGLPLVGHVWASTLPTSGWLPTIGSLLLGSSVVVKSSLRTDGLATVFASSLHSIERRWMGRVLATTWGRSVGTDADLVAGIDGLVVSGGHDAMAAFAAHVASRPGGPIPYVPFGPGHSLAVVPAAALASEDPARLAAAVALDVAAYDQQGCLSPRAVWVEGTLPEARALAARLADALTALAVELPRGEVSEGAAAAIMQRVGAAHFVGEVFDARDGAVMVEPEPTGEPNPLYRTVPVHLYTGGPSGLAAALAASGQADERLHALGVAGGDHVRGEYVGLAMQRRASRVCAPGTMQTPPLGWHHDGLSWLGQLARFVDLG